MADGKPYNAAKIRVCSISSGGRVNIFAFASATSDGDDAMMLFTGKYEPT